MRMKAKNVMRGSVILFVVLWIAVIIGCENKPASNSNATPGGTPSSRQSKSGATGSMTANPNPIQVCDGSDLGVTNISWDFSGAKRVEVHVGSPFGQLLALAGAPGTQSTGKWVGNGTVFYLQDVSNGLPLTADYTIATVTANVTTKGCS